MKPHDDWRESELSALFDDELTPDDAERCLNANGQALMERWCDYQDVRALLQGTAGGTSSQAFLDTFRARVAEVKPVTAMQPVAADVADKPVANDSVFRWKLVAGLASCATVAVLAWSVLGQQPAAVAPTLAQAAPSFGSPSLARVQGFARVQAPAAPVAVDTVADAAQREVMLRDPALDEFLRAHGAQAGAMALENTSGFMRNATYGRDGL